eukprot:2349721-Pleurochrysis_carterae.AAC.2
MNSNTAQLTRHGHARRARSPVCDAGKLKKRMHLNASAHISSPTARGGGVCHAGLAYAPA